ncbi:MAG: Flp pilus assembly complex ATPase component TadA [Lentisphaeria bacterium]|nr:Flp pilus assembly complex ATPase component TadA [Lentisphaeria bacterium]
MIQIIINSPGKKPARAKLDNAAYLIGSAADCHIRLDRPEISAYHAQLIVQNSRIQLMDLGSSNGTIVNGNPLYPHEPYDIRPGDKFDIGRINIELTPEAAQEPVRPAASAQSSQPSPPQKSAQPSAPQREMDEYGKEKIPLLKISGVSPEDRVLLQEIKKLAHKELLVRLNLKKLAISGISEEDLAQKAKSTIAEIVSQLNIPLPSTVPLDVLKNELFQEAVGLGPLEYLIAMDDITEIMVNGPDNVYVERKGELYRTDTAFADNHQVIAAIERIVSPLGRRIDESSPMVDARLPDGSRVNAIIPPLALEGPSITIRKFSRKPLEAADLIRFGSISPEIVHFLDICVKVRKNILISGGTGSGKTTLLNVLSSFLPNRERIITVEDAAELQLHQEHLVRLESRPPNVEGRGEISIRDLVRNCLRMRPDRIVVGECRGGEALDMLQAMNTGHDGSLTTIHANSPRDALARLETLVLMAGFDLPLRAIREQIASAIHIIVQISRERDGSRKVMKVSEITKMEGDVITLQDIFEFHQEGWDANNRIVGSFRPTGGVPTFLEEIERAKLPLDIAMFDPKRKTAGGIG